MFGSIANANRVPFDYRLLHVGFLFGYRYLGIFNTMIGTECDWRENSEDLTADLRLMRIVVWYLFSGYTKLVDQHLVSRRVCVHSAVSDGSTNNR